MSGHSKWSTIKRQKHTTDAVRGQLFTKIANVISVAIVEGGTSDPEGNVRLRLAIEKAKAANMPKSSIERAIARATGTHLSSVLEDVLYEGFGPGGVAILAEGITDNKQRTAALVKHTFHAHGGTLGSAGSCAYLFERVGAIYIEKNSLTNDELLTHVIDSGGNDLEDEGDRYVVITDPAKLHQTKKYLDVKKVRIIESELVYQPKTKLIISDRDTSIKLIALLKSLDELPDIHKVYTDAHISDEYIS